MNDYIHDIKIVIEEIIGLIPALLIILLVYYLVSLGIEDLISN